MSPLVRCIAASLCPLLLVAGCGSSPRQRTARELDNRLQARLSNEIAANRVALQRLPDGARVTLLDSSLLPVDVDATTDKFPATRASLVEALLDPDLMRVQVADTSSLPRDQRDARVRNVVQYFVANGLGSVVRQPELPAKLSPATVAPQATGLTITISVECPRRHDGAGYGTGQRKPSCY